MKSDAIQVRDLADNLQSLDLEGTLNFWQYDSTVLQETRNRVNSMDAILCRLETIRRVTDPWEKTAIDRIAPSVVELTDATQNAVEYLDHNHQALMFPAYTDQAEIMYNKSNRIVNSVGRYEEYATDRNEARQLGQEARQLKETLDIGSSRGS